MRIKTIKISINSIAENYIVVASMKPIKRLTGNEFSPDGTNLTDRVLAFFDGVNNIASNEMIGEVELGRKSIKSDIAHGIGRLKASAFMALPEVIEKGEIVDMQFNWKGRRYDTVVIAAPITIDEDDYYMAVVIHRDKRRNIQRHYVHEVLLQKKKAANPSGPGSLNASVTPGGSSAVFNILRKLQEVNREQKNDS